MSGEDEAPCAPGALGRVLRSLITGVAIIAVLGYVFWAGADSMMRGRDRMARAEVTALFTRAIAEGLVPNPPAPATDFMFQSNHGMEPYFIKYTGADGQRTGYSARLQFSEKPGQWEFRSLTEPPRHTFHLSRSTR